MIEELSDIEAELALLEEATEKFIESNKDTLHKLEKEVPLQLIQECNKFLLMIDRRVQWLREFVNPQYEI